MSSIGTSSNISVIQKEPPTGRLSYEVERKLIIFAQDLTDERRRNWAYRKLQESCDRVIGSLLGKYTLHLSPADQQDASAAAKEAFVWVVQNFELESEARLATVVFTYVRQALQRIIRKIQHQQEAIAKLKHPLEASSPAPEISDPYLVRQLEALITLLNPAQQAVVSLRITTELTWEEIGEQLGKQADATRKQFHRAILRLRDLFFSSVEEVSTVPQRLCEGVNQLCHAAITKLQAVFFHDSNPKNIPNQESYVHDSEPESKPPPAQPVEEHTFSAHRVVGWVRSVATKLRAAVTDIISSDGEQDSGIPFQQPSVPDSDHRLCADGSDGLPEPSGDLQCGVPQPSRHGLQQCLRYHRRDRSWHTNMCIGGHLHRGDCLYGCCIDCLWGVASESWRGYQECLDAPDGHRLYLRRYFASQ